MIELAVGVDVTPAEEDEVTSVDSFVVEECLPYLYHNLRYGEADPFLQGRFGPHAQRVEVQEIVEDVLFDLHHVVLGQDALDFTEGLFAAFLVFEGAQDLEVEALGDVLTLGLNIVVVFLKFLEEVEQLILLLDDAGRDRVDPAQVEPEQEPLEV